MNDPLMLILFGLLVVFLIWSSRSHRKQQTAYQNYLDSLTVGNAVETIGGLRGTIAAINGDELTLNIGARGTVLIRVGRVGIKYPVNQQQVVNTSDKKSDSGSPKKVLSDKDKSGKSDGKDEKKSDGKDEKKSDDKDEKKSDGKDEKKSDDKDEKKSDDKDEKKSDDKDEKKSDDKDEKKDDKAED